MKRLGAVFVHPIDWIPTTVIVGAVALGLAPYFVAVPGPALAAVALVSFAGRLLVPAHQHSHTHLRVFRRRALNTLYDQVLTLGGGYSAMTWELHHRVGHHRLYLDPVGDVAGVQRFAFTAAWSPLARRLAFTVLADLLAVFDAWRMASLTPRSARRKRVALVADVGLELAILGMLTWLDWQVTLAIFWLPNVLLRWLVMWMSFGQHEATPGTHVYDAAMTSLGPLNRIFLNVGHHTAHHERPALHWSLLPERTARILHRIPPACLRGTASHEARDLAPLPQTPGAQV